MKHYTIKMATQYFCPKAVYFPGSILKKQLICRQRCCTEGIMSKLFNWSYLTKLKKPF